jgi:gas vesicle protein
MNNEYKTFTARIDTPTLLDEFAPTYIDDIAQRFKAIERLKVEYCDRANSYARNFRSYNGFEKVVEDLNNSSQRMEQVFNDFQNRMKYFTLVFFGAVSAGKTSTICDLANMNPVKLTEIISRQSNFNPQEDGISIGPNVATINLYEILIEKSCIRLVDVPGIGGVVHENDSLAPFVDMADCIIFLLDANSDIAKDDYDFLFDNVAVIDRATAKSHGNGFTAEKGLDKKVIVVINKWKSTYQNRPPAHAEKDWQRKKEWILHGDKNKSFSGIAELFSKTPEVVRTNTTFRDEDTGERYPAWEELLEMEDLVNTLRDILQVEGASLRLNRPRQILSKEISKVGEALADEKTKQSIDKLVADLNKLGIKISGVSDIMKTKFDSRLDNLAAVIKDNLSPQIKRIAREWKPEVDFGQQLKMMVPDWMPWRKNLGWGKEEVIKEIKPEWEEEIRSLIKEKVDFSRIESLVKQEAETLATLIGANFRVELSDASPELVNKITSLKSSVQTDSVSKDDAIVSLRNTMDGAVSKIESELFNDILGVLTFDLILGALIGAVLTPAGSILFAVIRRWLKGDKKKNEIRQEIDLAIDEVVGNAAMDIRNKVAEKVREGIEESSDKIREILNQEQETLGKPNQLLNDAIADLKELQIKLNSMSF